MSLIVNIEKLSFSCISLAYVFSLYRRSDPNLGEGGRIITIGSVNADRIHFPGGSLYAMTKAAVAGLTRDLGPRAITVNNIQPSPVETDMNPASGPFAEDMKRHLALGRFGRSEEIAAFVSYLAGPESAFITGASFNIDGGYVM